jgi:phosphoglycerate dehydrogenase-like enzyme
MTGLLVTRSWVERYGDRLASAAASSGVELDYIYAPEDAAERLAPEVCERIEFALFSKDVAPELWRAFFAAVQGAPNLRWLHVYNTGVDSPVYPRLLARGVRVTNSSGSTAIPVAECAITGMLMLAHGFPRWMRQQREHGWDKMAQDEMGRDLAGQVIVVVGLGPIRLEIARLAKALRLHVIGVRRSDVRPDAIDELRHPSELHAVLPRADWLAIAAPLTPETRGMFGEAELALLPPRASVLNVARGELIDEAGLVSALASGKLAGAYLDVFETEPLPPDSPLWDLPNVIISPHDAGASAGNDDRVAALFLDNLARWSRGEQLVNDIAGAV